MAAITVRYSCSVCFLDNINLDVPERDATEDVRDWMERTVRLTWEDHWRRSPSCRAKMLSNLMIPMTGRPMIGGPVEN